MRTDRDGGFTFIETVIVIAIILILSAGVGFSSVRFVDQARFAAARNQIAAYKLALESYFLECGAFPTEAQGLASLWEKPTLSPVPSRWGGPYVDQETGADPWGNPYIYRAPGQKGLPFTIMSRGADGLEGGEGKNADILSWKR